MAMMDELDDDALSLMSPAALREFARSEREKRLRSDEERLASRFTGRLRILHGYAWRMARSTAASATTADASSHDDDRRSRLDAVNSGTPIHKIFAAVDETVVQSAAAACSRALQELREVTSTASKEVLLYKPFLSMMTGIIQCVSNTSVVMYAQPDAAAVRAAIGMAAVEVGPARSPSSATKAAGRRANEAAASASASSPAPEPESTRKERDARAAARATARYTTSAPSSESVAPVALLSQRAALSEIAECNRIPDYIVCAYSSNSTTVAKRPIVIVDLKRPLGDATLVESGRIQLLQYCILELLPWVERCCEPMHVFGVFSDGVTVSVLRATMDTEAAITRAWWLKMSLLDESGAPGEGFRALCTVLQASCTVAREPDMPFAPTVRVELLHGFPRYLAMKTFECTRLGCGGYASVFALPRTIAEAPPSSLIIKASLYDEEHCREVDALQDLNAVHATMPACAAHIPQYIGNGVAVINGWHRLSIVSAPCGTPIGALGQREGFKRGSMARVAMEGVLRALAGAHTCAAVARAHLDVRPANIVMVSDPAGWRGVLIDWNISKRLGTPVQHHGVSRFAHPVLWFTPGPALVQYDLYSAALTYAALVCGSYVGDDDVKGWNIEPKWVGLRESDADTRAGDCRLQSLATWVNENTPDKLRVDFEQWHESVTAYCTLQRAVGVDAPSAAAATSAPGPDMYLPGFPWLSAPLQDHVDENNGIATDRKRARTAGSDFASAAASSSP